MDQVYKLWFAPTSSDTHGEWPALDRYVLTRCQQLAHRRHRIPRMQPNLPARDLADLIMDVAEEIVDDYLQALATQEASLTEEA